MTVKELQELTPKAEVYELRPDCKYIIKIDRQRVSELQWRGLLQVLGKIGVTNAALLLLTGDMDSAAFMELES